MNKQNERERILNEAYEREIIESSQKEHDKQRMMTIGKQLKSEMENKLKL